MFTLVGFGITITIAIGGFRSFERWRREKLEERRIETAFEALTIAHETKFIFGNIRSPLTEGYEWADMPAWENDTEDRRSRRGPYYASIKRINANAKFFERVWAVQPRCMALFGASVEHTFLKLHQARRYIEVAAQMLAHRASAEYGTDNEQLQNLYEQMRQDIWDLGGVQPELDRVGRLLTEFVSETISFAEPVVAHQYRRNKPRWWRPKS